MNNKEIREINIKYANEACLDITYDNRNRKFIAQELDPMTLRYSEELILSLGEAIDLVSKRMRLGILN